MGVKETTFILPVTTTELSYASGNLPGRTSTRFNRTGRSTVDEDIISTKDGFINEELRAGGPHLCEMRSQDFDLLPCPHDDVISSIWDMVVESIFSAIGKEGVRAIGCYRIRTPYTRNKKDMPVTVVVDVDQRARRSWKLVRDAIISVLEQWTLCHVGVLIRQDTKTKDVNVGCKQFVPVKKSLQTRSVARIGRLAGRLGLVCA
ncbi:hypothetical protein HFD88_008507 [Aspergillus terreus]|nr:hypothetical protein HFD88_008507 [Aspergillus terreus]